MNFLIFRDFFIFFLNFFEFKINFINRPGDVAQSGAFVQIVIVDQSGR